jgi:predicted DNA-binding transcriptional regulator AlpA
MPHVESLFVLRPELLSVVPHSMSTIDRLEAEGQFPKRIRLEPTSRVAWLRREVTAYVRRLAKRRSAAEPEAAARISFDPAPGQIFCKCGAQLVPLSLHHRPDGALITCHACHAALAQINTDLETRS